MKIFRDIVVLILCMQLVMPNVLFNIAYLPAFVAHFEHHHHHEEMSFLEFINLHYANDAHQGEDKDHEKLPFHSSHNIIALGWDFSVSVDKGFSYERNLNILEMDIKLLYPKSINFHDLQILDSIWQPPKFSIVMA